MKDGKRFVVSVSLVVALMPASGSVRAQNRSPVKPTVQRNSDQARRERPVEEANGSSSIAEPGVFPQEVRSIDGTGNNLTNPFWGSATVVLLRLTTANYADGAEAPSGSARPSAREISNLCAAQERDDYYNSKRASDYLWQWGQFVDHDIDLTPTVEPAEPFDIEVPVGDPYFDPYSTGTATIPLDRSYYEIANGVREQVNEITAYIDASNVYGSDEDRANALRTHDGTGRLRTSEGNLLPFNVEGFPNAPSDDASFYLAGDFRANEQAALTSMHTLFVREHNYWADMFGFMFPDMSGDQVYQLARAMVAAEIQAITYNEFLPVLLGPDALRPYRGYRPDVNAGIANVFATAAYRLGHSMLSSELLRLDQDGHTIAEGNLDLADAFFNPSLLQETGVEPVLRGLAAQVCQEIDNYLVDDVRNFLFGPPGAGGFDLAALNIQRGRDHGLPSYNQVRMDYGLSPATTFADLNGEPEVQAALATAYSSPDQTDVWVGGLAEEHLPGAMVGETYFVILKDQFERLRDGDRFWYEVYLPPYFVDIVEQQTLSRIIQRNTGIGNELPANVFVVDRGERPQQTENQERPPRRRGRR